MASSSSSPRFKPARPGGIRDDIRLNHSRPSSEASAYNDPEDGVSNPDAMASASAGPSRDSHKKLDQIIQNFHIKAAILILQSRMSLPIIMTKNGSRKVNKWFQIETDDTEAFQEELRIWKTCGGFENRPPVMIIETYLDTSDLTSNQSLVVVDDHGKRWDVSEALNNSTGSDDRGTRHQKPRTEVVLERWRIEMTRPPDDPPDFGAILPTVYKKCIVFFRSLYATAKFVPAWKFAKNLAKSTKSNLRVNCRVLAGDEFQMSQHDPLTHPLYDSYNAVTTTYFLGETDSPAGRFRAELSYRNDCNFRVDDSEALLSSRFMGADENYFQPSLGNKSDPRRQTSRTAEVGSLPAHRQHLDDNEPIQAYGSMSTFHGNAPLGSSPISALRNARTMGSESNSPPVGSSLRSRPIQTSTPASRALEGVTAARRPSLSFNPFKAGSLASSPIPGTPISQGEMLPPQSPQSYNRNSGISQLHQARNRSSLTAGMPASLRGVPIVPDNVVSSSASSSPKPRYSSSFSHRRGKPSFGGTSKVGDDQGSSGQQSLSSSAQPGSGVLAEAAGGASSGSIQTDDDQISDLLKFLDKNKDRTMKSSDPARGEARTSAQLSRFRLMQESNNALTESMSSSTLLHRSSSTSSRQLSSVPPMVAATSASTSSSPGKPVSPHTPHTPAIPSRLSANSIAEYSQPRRLSHRTRPTQQSRVVNEPIEPVGDEATTNAIDIPTSPRPFYPHVRRSSSVSQQHRALAVDDDVGDLPFGPHRSVSLGDQDREPPTLSSLLGLGQTSGDAPESSSSHERTLQPAPDLGDESPVAMARELSQSQEPEDGPQPTRGLAPGSITAPYRPRIGRMGRGLTPPQTGSFVSLPGDRGSGSGSGISERPGSRYSFSRPAYSAEDDEPLLFDMSEIGRDQQSRRSLEEGRGGASAGGSISERGGYESSRGGDSGSSSRRGSRRGW